MQTDRIDLLSALAENVPGALFRYTILEDGREHIEFLNDNCHDIWCMTADEIGADPSVLWTMVHKDDEEGMRASVGESARNMTRWEHRWRLIDNCGQQKWVLGRGVPERLSDGAIRWTTFIFDVTAQMEAEDKAAVATRQLVIAIEALPDGFALYDAADRLVICNSRYREIYAQSAPAIVPGATFESILRFGLENGQYSDAIGREDIWLKERLSQHFRAENTIEQKMSDGRWLRILERATPDGGRVGFRIDITELKEKQLELERTVLTDPLTGLSNRRALSESITASTSELGAGERLAFFHLDLDKFKTVNDAIGHEAGDFVLREVAQTLLKTVVENATIARVGGDEFVVALTTEFSDPYLLELADELRDMITMPMKFRGRVCQIGATIGISSWAIGSRVSVEQALLDADTALLYGKSLGRNKSVLFSEEMRENAVEKAKIASHIKEGLKRHEFVPFFQPQVELPSGEICGFETLVRWNRGERGCLPAGSFIAVAHETGLVGPIDRMMLDGSMEVLNRLSKAGMKNPSVSLNLSSTQLSHLHIAEQVLWDVEAHGVDAGQVAIEIVESTLLDGRNDTISANIHKLADAGFRIELDDFGTGHTALASLREFPVHRIKIDRSLIRNIDADKDIRAITEGIFSLCNKLDVDVIAEGVETEAEVNTLTEIGFCMFQGYYFSVPMGAEDLFKWLRGRGEIIVGPASGWNDRPSHVA